MKTAKDLKIPFTWEERRPILLERFFYIPGSYPYERQEIPFFEDAQPVVIEYCSGNGQWIGDRARQNPHLNFLAVEKKFERARKIWLKSHRENLTNLCTICGDGRTFTRYYAPKVLDAYINFPDPWPKLRHAKHRIVRSEFLETLALVVTGSVTCATDDIGYFGEMEMEFSKCPQWRQTFKGIDLPDYGNSFFKDLWHQMGRKTNYLIYSKGR